MEDRYSKREWKADYSRWLKRLREAQKDISQYLKRKGMEYAKHPGDVHTRGLSQMHHTLGTKIEVYRRTFRAFMKVRNELIDRQIKHPGDKWGGQIGDQELQS